MYTQHSRVRQALPVRSLLIVLIILGLTGCQSLNKTQKGAAIGTGAGAVLGGVIGKKKGNTKAGAVIGGAVGGTIGAVIGHQMDKQAKELEETLDDAVVERVGDGIQVTFDSAILFDFDDTALQHGSRTDLANLASNLQQYPNTNVVIYGHTDAVGSETYNQRLSEQRADAVRYELLRQGVSSQRLNAIGLGEGNPVASNTSADGRRLNRRVELSIEVSDAYLESLQASNTD